MNRKLQSALTDFYTHLNVINREFTLEDWEILQRELEYVGNQVRDEIIKKNEKH